VAGEETMAIPIPRAERDDGVTTELTRTGFKFGAATVDRVTTLPGGQACLRIETPRIALNIRVTKTGRMRVTTDQGIEVVVTR
jgi:hypothetical protein